MWSTVGEHMACSETREEPDEQILVMEKTRAETPDSGGGYFTLSESDSGSTLGKESPSNCRPVITPHHKQSKQSHNLQDGKIRLNLTTKSESNDNNNCSKINQEVSKATLPPRPSRTSTDIAPTVPKKMASKSPSKRDGVYIQRDVVIPSHKPLKKIPPLQIQSPSLIKTFQKASSTEDISNQLTSRRHSQGNAAMSKRVPINQAVMKKSNSFSSTKNSPMNEKKFPKFSKVVPNPRDIRNVKQNENKKNSDIKEHEPKNNVVLRQPKTKEIIPNTIANESLASRAKKSSESRIKQLYKSVYSPSKPKEVKSTAGLQRNNSLGSEPRSISGIKKKSSPISDQPVHSLIKIYDKNMKIKKSIKKESMVVISNAPNNNENTQEQCNKWKPRRTVKENTELKNNSIDEFLRSVKRTKQKYQEMLNKEAEKSSESSLEVKTEPTESDLQTGCFTDVSFSGYFANKRSPEIKERNLLNNNIIPNTEMKKHDGARPNISRVESFRRKHPLMDKTSSKSTENSKLFDKNITPTPSPRINKRLRREQILQEHKQMGKEVLAMAKASTYSENHILNNGCYKVNKKNFVTLYIYLYFRRWR